MELHIVIEGRKDLAGQLYRQLGDAIRSGRLAHGQQLPPSRLLAEQLGVSRKTVSDAYSRLTLDNLVVGKAGAGSFVQAPARRSAQPAHAAPLAAAATVARWDTLPAPLRHPQQEGGSRFEFVGGRPAASLFPQEDWRRCILHGMRQETQRRGRYTDAEGVPALRDAIARHVAFTRGVACTAAQVVVTNGAQQALDLLGRILLEPGSVAAVEDPGYPAARMLFAGQGAHVAGVPVDRDGIVPELIPASARLIYVTPAHQFPLGVPMSVARKRALLARARAIGAIVIEDDYDSAFRYEGRPTDSLKGMDKHGLVAYVGTFSKVLTPELRLGFMVAPDALLNAVHNAKHYCDWHTATLAQHALARFISDGALLKHIRRCHAVYAQRRERLQAGFAAWLAPWFELLPATAGFHLAAQCKDSMDMDQLLRLARRADVGLYTLGKFYCDHPPREGLLLGYGAIDTLDIDAALLRVRDILGEMR
ncbi:PLP-dependent aminotransferase family protein [Pseudoduganella ginsengisoli]|uniref:Aminotransferase class I/II-fold pyridoxal phosphate-dependent enzyme n=1 Tax=Pseudoduganella ginsengisoli TaxID=1462440 RepID=A0A6L6PWR0_9BURK|nr:PLP-dependent aminotransferase family protein [Pseudoduganella ginsengisoli]MTW01418.1 aminotransferase class I/II-fold pyridoxal phosphate-dependent enzyme [Pseudoduganella ginsengisoli]